MRCRVRDTNWSPPPMYNSLALPLSRAYTGMMIDYHKCWGQCAKPPNMDADIQLWTFTDCQQQVHIVRTQAYKMEEPCKYTKRMSTMWGHM